MQKYVQRLSYCGQILFQSGQGLRSAAFVFVLFVVSREEELSIGLMA